MWTYMTCVPGAPGTPGRDGAKGDLGSPGKTGTKGTRGDDGKKGAKGEPGIQGSAGQKGQQGDKGDSGTARLASHMNWKECTWKRLDRKNSGLIYVSAQRHFITRIKGTISRYCAWNFDFLTGCHEFRRYEEGERTLKNLFASRLVKFDTTPKFFRITDQWYIVHLKFRFGRNRDFMALFNFIAVGRRTKRRETL